MTISAQGEIRSTPTDNRGEREPLEGEQKAAFTKAAEGFGKFGPDLKKEKQNSGQVEFSVSKWDN